MRVDDDRVRAVYGWRAASRWAFLLTIVVVTVLVVPMLLAVAFTNPSWAWRIILLLACAGWLAWAPAAAWRTAFTLELTDERLRWRGALRRGEIPLADIRAVRPVRVLEAAGWHAIVADGHPPLWILVSRGFDRLAEDLRADVQLSWATKRPDRIPGRSQYRRIADPTDPF
jgi:hypothetical protein